MAPIEVCLYGAGFFAAVAAVLKGIQVWINRNYYSLTRARKHKPRRFI